MGQPKDRGSLQPIGSRKQVSKAARVGKVDSGLSIEESEKMRVKVYELKPSLRGHVIDKDRLHCIIDVKDGQGSFRFLDTKREKMIRELFDAGSNVFVAGGQSPDGVHFDAMEHHSAWSKDAIEAIVRDELYGFNLGATIEQDRERWWRFWRRGD
jgi:hypothetical protein